MGALKAAALILTVRAALIGGPDAAWPVGPADEGQLTPNWQLHSRFGDAFFLPATPWQITGDMVQFDARSGLTVITGPSEETVQAAIPDQAATATSTTQTEGAQAGQLPPAEMDLPTTDVGRTAYLEEVEPGLYRRKDLAETAGYGIKVSASPGDDKASIAINLSYQELADGRFEEALGAYVSRPAVTRKETQFQCSQSVPTQVLLIWRVPGLSHGHGLLNAPGLEGAFGYRSGAVSGVPGPSPLARVPLPGTRATVPEASPLGRVTLQGNINLDVSDASLADVVAMLAEACPGVQVVLADAALRDCRVAAINFRNATLASALRGICAALGLQCDWDGERWLVHRGAALLPPGFPQSLVSGLLRPQLAVLVDLRPADEAEAPTDVLDTAHPTASATTEGAASPRMPSGPPATSAPPTTGDAPTGAPRVPDSPTSPQPQPITDDPELAEARLKELEADLEAAKIRLEQAKRRAEEGKSRAESGTITTSEAADLQEAYDLAKVDLARVEAQIATQQLIVRRATAAQKKEVTVVITGQVKAPGAYVLPPGSTVVDLIARAGGVTGKGDAAHVSLMRTAGGPEVRELDLGPWLAPPQGAPTLPPPETLQSGDVLLVPERGADIGVIGDLRAGPEGKRFAVHYNLATDATVTVLVANLAGRTVARLADGVAQTAGPQTVPWSGRTDGGVKVPAGRYIVLVTASTDAGQDKAARAVEVEPEQ